MEPRRPLEASISAGGEEDFRVTSAGGGCRSPRSVSRCVEVADLDGGCRAVRDSKNPAGPALTFTVSEWAAFTTGVRAGEFDLTQRHGSLHRCLRVPVTSADFEYPVVYLH